MSPWQMHLAPDSQLDHEPHPHRSLLLTRLVATSRVPARDQNGGDQHHGPLASRMEGAPHVDGNAKPSSGCAARLLQQHQIAMNSASPRKARQGSRCAANRQMQPNLSRIIFQALPLLRKFHDELANDHRRALLTGWQRFASFPNTAPKSCADLNTVNLHRFTYRTGRFSRNRGSASPSASPSLRRAKSS